MKKIFILATAAIVAFASCMKTEVVSNSEPQEIAFRQFTGSMTKSDPTDLDSYASTMGVFGYHKLASDATSTLYIDNGKFIETTTEDVWGGDPDVAKYYWPLQGTLDFTVYAPYAAGTSYENGTAKLSVTIADNSTTQADYLYGKVQYKNQSKPVSPATSVPVVLKHALSKVTINMKASDDNIFTVSSVLLKQTVQNGSYTVSYTSDTDNKSAVVAGETTKDIEFVSSDWALLKEVGDNTASKLVVPSAQTSIVITYRMAGSNAPLTATTTLSGNWETGTHYTYNITLTATEILLNPTVEAWTDGTESPVTIPE